MDTANIVIAEFYEGEDAWPEGVFMQGDVLGGGPRVLMAPRGIVPAGGTPEATVPGEASYCRTRAMIISPSCNLLRTDSQTLIQVAAVVQPRRPIPRDKRDLYINGRVHKAFLLREHPTLGEQLVLLTDVWSVGPEHIDGLTRIICLSDWGRSLLADALYRAFARPIHDASYSPSDTEGCRPGSGAGSPVPELAY